MSSIDKRLESYWAFARAINRLKEVRYLDLMRDMAQTDTGVAQKAASRFLARHGKAPNVAHSG